MTLMNLAPAVPLITARVQTPNARLLDLLTKPGSLTAAEWAYVTECERHAQ